MPRCVHVHTHMHTHAHTQSHLSIHLDIQSTKEHLWRIGHNYTEERFHSYPVLSVAVCLLFGFASTVPMLFYSVLKKNAER